MSLQKRGASKKPFGIQREKENPDDGQGRTQSIATKIKIKAPGVIFFHVTEFRAQLKRARTYPIDPRSGAINYTAKLKM